MSKNIEQYDATQKEMRMVQDRMKIRTEFRKEYIKQFTNPHRHGEGGYLFDPALQRWQSMKAQQWYYFKPTQKTVIYPLVVLGTCLGYGYWFHLRRSARDKEYRQGLVAYRDRQFKFV